MRASFDRVIADLDSDELLTTGEAAALLGSSRQHVVNLIERGDLAAIRIGAHRRVRRGDLLEIRRGSTRATRDQERSRWLGIAVAGELIRDPESVRAAGRAWLARTRARPNRWNEEWGALLDGPVEPILTALTADTPHARELRQNSPFASVLSDEDRTRILASFRESR